MSDNMIYIIPVEPSAIPTQEKQDDCRNYLVNEFQSTADISTFVSETIEFIDCGENFETIACPLCKTELEIDWWQEKMESDFSDEGFVMRKFKLPCCGKKANLNELTYHFDQGFAKYRIEITNINSNELSSEEISEIENKLKIPIKIIYKKI